MKRLFGIIMLTLWAGLGVALAQDDLYSPAKFTRRVGSISAVPFFHPTKSLLWYAWTDSTLTQHYYAYSPRQGKFEVASLAAADSLIDAHNASCIRPGTSPSELFHLEVKAGNLWADGRQLTVDASHDYSFELANVVWLNDSLFYITRRDHRGVRKFPVVYTTVPGSPIVREYDYELPGDSVVASTELFVGNAASGRLTKVHTALWPCQELSILKVNDVNHRVYFIRSRRTRNEAQLCYADVMTGRVVTLIDEKSMPYINPDLFCCHVLNRGRDILLWSDRTGWGHYYHYDGEGHLLNAVTSGDFTAGRIVAVDTLGRKIYFYGYGREKACNPNYALLYRVGFNGKGMQLLTPENAHHKTFVSPNLRLIFDIFSRIDAAPKVVVRKSDGRIINTLEQVSLTGLKAFGYRHPEQFVVKAADGKTNLYGIMWKPFDFNPMKKYPIISQVYPGPFTDTVWPDFQLVDKYHNYLLAQAGFIVVVMGHRGSSPYRCKSYATYGYGRLRDYALEDDVYGLRQLCRRYHYIDSTRVGITGHSGGAMMAVTALCTYPDFYKAAVASSGNYDNYIYNRFWGETYQGIASDTAKFHVDTVQELIPRLQGSLLLVTGESDQNVHPAHTMRVVDALIRNDKPFEMLVLPAQGHHFEEPYQSYFDRRKISFFRKALQ